MQYTENPWKMMNKQCMNKTRKSLGNTINDVEYRQKWHAHGDVHFE